MSLEPPQPAQSAPADELTRRRDALARRFADLQWDLGGIAYEMASRDHFRLDVLTKQAAELQRVDTELAGLERMLRLGDAGAAGSCSACGALYARGASFCWSCGATLIEPAVAPSWDGTTRGGIVRYRLYRLGDLVTGIGVLTVTSRRWSASLLASALGMGLFIGVAFGPATDQVGALGAQVVAVEDTSPPAAAPVATTSQAGSGAGGGGTGAGGSSTTDPASDPYVPPATSAVPTAEPPVETPPADPPPADPPADDGTDDDPPAEEDPFALAGTVVQANPLAESYALSVRGELYAIHARDLPKPGDRLEVATRELANGTYAEDGEPVTDGTTERGILNGFVTFVSADPLRPAYTLSARGVSVAIRLPASGEPPELPKLGAFVSVEAEIAEPPDPVDPLARVATAFDDVVGPADTATTACVREEAADPIEPEAELVEQELEPSGDVFTYFDLAGVVQAVCPETGEVVISADGIRQSGFDMTLTAPTEIDLERLGVDEAVLATAELAEDGSLLLAGAASDDGIDGADDSKQLQGDLAGG